MRENRPYGSEGGEAKSLPYPYHGWMGSLLADLPSQFSGWRGSAGRDRRMVKAKQSRFPGRIL